MTEPSNLDWYLDGPDPEGKVWLFSVSEPIKGFHLGDYEQVAEYLAGWLAANDFGE